MNREDRWKIVIAALQKKRDIPDFRSRKGDIPDFWSKKGTFLIIGAEKGTFPILGQSNRPFSDALRVSAINPECPHLTVLIYTKISNKTNNMGE